MKGKKYLIVDDYMLDIILNKIQKIIGTEKFDNAKILIDTDDKQPDYITFKNVVILVKGTLLQIWKSANIFDFIWKYVEDFT